ncbi:MFS transporter [Sporomusa sp.]|uniref:MFS transporter n=1 Tax=Sporomusa sp. TaxID=2078658 RepID=UPI002B7D90D0|nr:MFS transporter [Sporomusa sp.]HWR42973.1 MFS transporter [Sporomusa sp.]
MMRNSSLLKLTILIANFACMADMVIIPAAGGIFAAFPDADPKLLDLILTGPMLASIAGSLLCGFLARYFSKKYILIGAYVLFIIGSCGGAWFANIYYVLVMRMIVGFAYGFVPTGIFALVSELYEEEEERSVMVGLVTASVAIWGIILACISGFLAVDDWRYSYYVYYAAIPILLMLVVFLPKTPPEGCNKEVVEERMPIFKVGGVALACFGFNTLYNIVVYYIAIYLQEAQIGDASTAGVITSMGTLGCMVSSLFFGKIYSGLKGVTAAVAYIAMAVAFIILSHPADIWTIGAMCLLTGAAFGIGINYYYMHSSMIVPPSIISLVMAIIAIAMNLGTFASSYALTLFQTIMHVRTIAPTFLYVGVIFGIWGVLSITSTKFFAKKSDGIEV